MIDATINPNRPHHIYHETPFRVGYECRRITTYGGDQLFVWEATAWHWPTTDECLAIDTHAAYLRTEGWEEYVPDDVEDGRYIRAFARDDEEVYLSLEVAAGPRIWQVQAIDSYQRATVDIGQVLALLP